MFVTIVLRNTASVGDIIFLTRCTKTLTLCIITCTKIWQFAKTEKEILDYSISLVKAFPHFIYHVITFQNTSIIASSVMHKYAWSRLVIWNYWLEITSTRTWVWSGWSWHFPPNPILLSTRLTIFYWRLSLFSAKFYVYLGTTQLDRTCMMDNISRVKLENKTNRTSVY